MLPISVYFRQMWNNQFSIQIQTQMSILYHTVVYLASLSEEV